MRSDQKHHTIFVSRAVFGILAAFLLMLPASGQVTGATRTVVCAGDDGGTADSTAITNALNELAGIAATPSHPNILEISGDCMAAVTVQDMSNLNIQGASGGIGTIHLDTPGCDGPPSGVTNVLNIVSSRNINLNFLVIKGGAGISLQDAGVRAAALTVQDSYRDGIGIGSGSTLVLAPFGGTATQFEERKNTVQDSCQNGISVGPGSNLVIRTWADIKGNHQAGIIAGPAGTMNVVACCAGSSSQFYGTIRISDNGVGVRVNAGGSAGLTAFQTPAGQVSEVVVENNANWGVLASNLSQVNLNGNVVVQGNMAAPSGGGAATFPAGVAAVTGSIVALGPGSKIQNNGGTTGTKIPAPGVRADLQGIVRLGSPAADATAPGFLGITITGNTDGGVVLTHMSIADSYPGNSFTGNTGSDASCDSSSQLVGDTKGIGVVKCSANAK